MSGMSFRSLRSPSGPIASIWRISPARPARCWAVGKSWRSKVSLIRSGTGCLAHRRGLRSGELSGRRTRSARRSEDPRRPRASVGSTNASGRASFAKRRGTGTMKPSIGDRRLATLKIASTFGQVVVQDAGHGEFVGLAERFDPRLGVGPAVEEGAELLGLDLARVEFLGRRASSSSCEMSRPAIRPRTSPRPPARASS